MKNIKLLLLLLLFGVNQIVAQKTSPESSPKSLYQTIDNLADNIESKVIEWRRHMHQNPELSNREFETAKYVAAHLKHLGMEVTTEVAHTGVIGVLKGGKSGPTIGLRADMDALPVTERVDLPFASKVKSTYLDEEVGVMHACGHDTHVAMLMGAAEILAQLKDEIQGTIVFIFQPAEEGAPPGEEGGAKLMVKEGIMETYGIDVVFGMHISSGLPINTIRYKMGGAMAASDRFVIKVKGKQTHGSRPWGGVDPITTSALIINGLQTIVSRQTELTKEAAVITIGKIQGGVRNNIIPEECEMIGTIRTLDVGMQEKIHEKIRKTATLIAESQGAEAEVDIQIGYPVTFNNHDLTRKMLPTLFRVAGEDQVLVSSAITGAEDFSFFAQKVPGLYFFLGGLSPDTDPFDAPGHHTPDFRIDERGMKLGVRTFCNMVFDYGNQQ